MECFENLQDYQRMSTDAENYIISKLGSLTFMEIASEVGVSVQTIANRAKAYGKNEMELQLNGNYRYLSMDEVFITRDKNGDSIYYWNLYDISQTWKSNTVRIDLGRNKEDVIKRLSELKHPEKIVAISTDMWKPYRDAILEAVPNAAIVIDKFHVIQLAQKAIDTLRKKSKVTGALKTEMKKDAKLFLTSFFKLNDDELDRLEIYLKADADLEKAYFIVQELSGFYHFNDYDAALNYLALWETEVLASGIEKMVDVLHSVQNWLPYIMNYFIHRITSGKTEGKNHLLRVIDKIGFHYGIDSIQACMYAHDRKQEYLKWQKYLRKKSKNIISA
jgi:transposase